MTHSSEDSIVKGDRVAISPALQNLLDADQVPRPVSLVDRRVVWICCCAIGLGVVIACLGQILIRLIYLVTNLSFFGRFSWEHVAPADSHLGLLVIIVPVVGALLIGLLARFGAQGIRGHGIPEAIEQVLLNHSRIPARITLLKPLSAAISIGTGGPFGVEGPIIATGGAVGSLLGQLLRISALERKTLLAAGAAAGVAATFGSPVAAVLLAIELLLFEYRPRSIIPVALASVTAAALRIVFEGSEAAFSLPDLKTPTFEAQLFYIALGALTGLAAVGVTKAVIFLEEFFEHLPIHWMWWPAIGAVAVGVIGYFEPRTLGAGYANINDLFHNRMLLQTVVILGVLKLISWTVAVGSGTSGGTLAPLFTVGSCLGAASAMLATMLIPSWEIDPRVAALVGMAAMFAGASRALLTSVVLAFETTLQPLGLLPLLGGCTASYLISCLLLKETIMMGKVTSRGGKVPAEYRADLLDQIIASQAATRKLVTLPAEQSLGTTQAWIASGASGASHQGFPLVDGAGHLVGILTRKDLLQAVESTETPLRALLKRPPRFIYDNCTLRQAVEHMVSHDIGRLPVVSHQDATKLLGILTRSDILTAYRHSLAEQELAHPNLKLPTLKRSKPKKQKKSKA